MIHALEDITNFSAIFEAMPGYNALLQVNPFRFTILAVTDDYLSNSGCTKEQLIGKGIFESFPSNPDDRNDTGEKNLLASFQYIIRHKNPHQLPVQRYDVPDENGTFSERYWVIKNKPVLNDDGEVIYIIHTAKEITNQVKAQQREEVIKGFEQVHDLFKQVPVAISILKGKDFIIELANEQMIEIYGKGKKILQRPLVEVLPELGSQGFIDLLNNVVTTGKSYHGYESPLKIIENGLEKIKYYNFVYQRYYEADSRKPAGILLVANDVTERVDFKKNLQESEQKIRTLVASAPFPIGVYIGQEMKIEFANQAILEAWGKGNDVIGKLYSDVLPELDKQEIFTQIQSVFSTGISFHAKNQRLDLVVDGKIQTYYFNYSFIPLCNSNGKVYGVMNTAADVSDLNFAKHKIEESEAQLRSLVMSAPIGICIVKGNPAMVEVVNDSFLEVVGKRREAFAYTPYWDVLPEAAAYYTPIFENVLRTGVMYRGDDHEVMLVRNGKEEIVYVNFVYDPVIEADGTVSKVMIVVIEVTEQVIARRKIEEVVAERTKELAEANRNLKKSNEELEQFAYIASHDLQEPLRKVSTFSQMLENSLPQIDESAKSYFSKINNSTSRMSNLINDVLAYSQLSKEHEIYDWVNLQEVIEWLKNDFELLIGQKQAIIQSLNLPTIQAIPLQMSQLFSNLLSNSLKFSTADVKPVITIVASSVTKDEIATYSLNQNTVYYNIEFKDNGIGFNQEYATRIFKIFQRLHVKTQYSGTGIGLAMCKKIVQNHHGAIFATASEGTGAIFNVILPERQVSI